jgi:DNA-directed RNA polymerase sigma subunit (sigma70/sigma32)
MIQFLKTIDEGSAAFRQQRDAIIERTLPLADHIALRFKNRGEPHEDLVQVARVGLINAIDRFDVTSGADLPLPYRQLWVRFADTFATTGGASKSPAVSRISNPISLEPARS